MDTEDQIPPSLPLQKGVPRFAGFAKEGSGEILEEYVWSIMDSLAKKFLCVLGDFCGEI